MLSIFFRLYNAPIEEPCLVVGKADRESLVKLLKCFDVVLNEAHFILANCSNIQSVLLVITYITLKFGVPRRPSACQRVSGMYVRPESATNQ